MRVMPDTPIAVARCVLPSRRRVHGAREQRVELVCVNYPFHPRMGEEVEVLGRSRHSRDDYLIIRQPDGTRGIYRSG